MPLKFVNVSGRQYLVINEFKFRETRTLKNGLISWRCCDKRCNASLKTDEIKSKVIDMNSDHKHDKPSHSQTDRNSFNKSNSNSTVTELSCKPTPPVSKKHPPATPLSTSTTTAHSTPLNEFCYSYNDHAGTCKLVQAENTSLRLEVEDLRRQLRAVTDHAVQSDTRLLRYTDEIFTSRSCDINSDSQQVSPVEVSEQELPKTADAPNSHHLPGSAAALAEPLSPANTGASIDLHQPVSTMEAGEQMLADVADATTNFNLQESSAASGGTSEDLLTIASLRTAIEVLEAELQYYRNVFKSCDADVSQDSCKFTEVNKKQSKAIQLQNRFAVLNNCQNKPTNNPNNKTTSRKSTKHQLPNRKSNKASYSEKNNKQPFNFDRVFIYSDSHGRQLGSFLAGMTEGNALVTGFCYPSAKLRQIIPTKPPPSGSCCIILAGTNDVADGQTANIYRNLEQHIISLLPYSKILISTLPYRHDLSHYHPINHEISVVNSYISELCSRYEGVAVLEINHIGRECFTKHGMHLARRGKRRLARMIFAKVQQLGRAHQPPRASRHSSLPARDIPRLDSPDEMPYTISPSYNSSADATGFRDCSPGCFPVTLPHETYAEAVIHSQHSRSRSSTATQERDNKMHSKSDSKSKVFLGEAL